ncbi:hypothetical protein T4B_7794 [Trichinella pseudospiralis]|uniref:Uncharacterized protein n=1 Tax=Trichinella pseudospiralis TaxID=6337 RepID=A0A0V1G864_TRIPS|nr:hypothetical protein T4A_1658 [Trichinella pseudospiralis]KRY94464.1 hypothetical protein T4B_7794 [Trichinella pseudospiralis]KRZ38570.1 hypothetical protein T4C_6523 [Trichinella pseudospiralis]
MAAKVDITSMLMHWEVARHRHFMGWGPLYHLYCSFTFSLIPNVQLI